MSHKNVICLVVDRLHAGMLGAYGNSWSHSEHFDHLAAESFLFDQAFIENPRIDRIYRAYWQGLHGACRNQPSAGMSLPHVLAAAGWHTLLITDEPEVARLATAGDFAQQTLLESPPVDAVATSIADTQMARLFMAVNEWLASAREPFCLWVHARGMSGAWDAPLELRNQFADPEDPTPPNFADVPDHMLAADYDPDELLGITHAYAGQVALLDSCLGALVEHLEESRLAATTQLTVLSARGFPLGEHLRVGRCDEALYNETAQIPWLMRFPDELGKMVRSQALVEPSDLPATLLEWLELDCGKLPGGSPTSLMPIVRGRSDSLRDCVYMTSDGERAIRTPAWFLRQPEPGPVELYTKPSDRWEVNDVSKLCEDVVAGLTRVVAKLEQTTGFREPPRLDDQLVTVVD